MAALWSIAGALWRRPVLRNGILILAFAAGFMGAAALYLRHERADAARSAIRAIEAEQSQGVKDAIKHAAPGPRPVGDEFLECLRRGRAGCL